MIFCWRSPLHSPTADPFLYLAVLPDENAHAPNEKLDLDNLHHGMLSAAYLFEELAEAGNGKV
jgi:acetylornithine deacetylase/succinyl-diaminopimelate desuccinylase-like protein